MPPVHDSTHADDYSYGNLATLDEIDFFAGFRVRVKESVKESVGLLHICVLDLQLDTRHNFLVCVP